MRRSFVAPLLILALGVPAANAAVDVYAVGVAQVDITPSFPVRLSGFGMAFRREETDKVLHRIWAKALAIGEKDPAVLITVDNCGVPAHVVETVAERLKAAGVARERLAISATHTHTAPMLHGVLPTLFGQAIPKEHQEHIDRYTAELTDNLEKAARAALADRKPAKLNWGIGKAGFAINRRTKGGPVDHDMPLLTVRDLQGKLRAIYVNYACHCVTLSHNTIGGDWAGFAQLLLQEEHPGAIALVAIGCGADSNPSSGVTGDKVEVAQRQGAEIAAEVRRLLKGYLAPVQGELAASSRRLELPLQEPPGPAVWEERAKNKTPAIAYHASVQRDRLARGEKLKAAVDYPVQTWQFGDSLAMVFLPGEVVVDYSLRLKRELDGLRLWINAYSNDAPCYIPSERVLKEGGYEGATAMRYYDLPGPFQPGLEQKIVDAVRGQLDGRFRPPFDPKKVGTTRPLPPQQARETIRTKNTVIAELMIAEPLVTSPVAISFGADGKLWVAEMYDYPTGQKGDYQPGGRVRFLEDTDGDGRFDKSSIFLDNIPFPTGVTVWRKGVLVCAAPDILYAEDTNGDGKADVVRKLYSGFGTHNYQARVNSLEYGLDGWVYGSCGIFGGTIVNFKGEKFALGDRDFRIKPDTGELEPATGRTQQGRVRDDWDNWFGCDNTNLLWHYPLADHYLRRNPHVAPPPMRVYVPDGPNFNKLYPAQADLQLFKLSGPAGQPTAICGLGIYRDDLLGEDYRGTAFLCEPVDLLIHHLKLLPRDSTFSGRRPVDEAATEFLASTDPWFRPVQVRTGPDGTLWIVDMYRYVIEHPRWIPPEQLAQVDIRAGSTMGRIYRVRSQDREPRAWPRLDKLDTAGLVAALDSPNGWQRDLAQQMLLWRDEKAAQAPLEALTTNPRAETRLHALCTLGALRLLRLDLVRQALTDAHPGVRRQAVRLAERWLDENASLGGAVAKLVDDSDAQVRLQLAYSLGFWHDNRAAEALVRLAQGHRNDAYLNAAVLSSIRRDNLAAALGAAVKVPEGGSVPLLRALLELAPALGARAELKAFFDVATTDYALLSGVLMALARRGEKLEQWLEPQQIDKVQKTLARARALVADVQAAEAERLSALQVLGLEPNHRDADRKILTPLLTPQNSAEIQSAAVAALGRIPADEIAAQLLAGWKSYSPPVQAQVLDVLITRPAWRTQVLRAVEKNLIPAGQIDARHRQQLMRQRDAALRALAERLFNDAATANRRQVLDLYADVVALRGDAVHGKEVFGKRCAGCHRLNEMGQNVGPDLAALANKTPQFLLQEILDPNRNVDARYTEYFASTKAGQTFTGILASESAASVTLRGQDGKENVLLRNELDELKNTGKSLMPEGLEKDLPKQDMADLLAYLVVPEANDPATLAKQILDKQKPDAERRKLIEQHLDRAPELVAALTADLTPDTPEEYVRIPWIWRVAVAAGKRNDLTQLRRLLEVSLPKAGEPLRDWQAVVIGGGIVNGISVQGAWPGPRLQEILKGQADLGQRWTAMLPQAAVMADDEKVKTGTRYDALRILALDDWGKRREQLAKYLAKGVHDEVQSGAISALSDVQQPQVATLLLGGMEHYSAGNRKLALEALLRDKARTKELKDAIQSGKVKMEWLSAVQRKALMK
jgi:putative membrane-bound dehydrogenase-like protein